MGASLRTKPKLMRVSIAKDGSYYEDQNGKYTLWQEAQWLVERQHEELTRLRTEVNKYKTKSQKHHRRLKTISELDND